MLNYIGNNINAIRVHYGLSQDQLAEITEVSQTTVSAWECGKSTPRRSNIEPLLSTYPELDYDAVYSRESGFAQRVLATLQEHRDCSIPLYGSISAGKSVEMLPVDEFLDISESLKRRYPKAFFLRVNGESMNRVLPNGCLALIDPTQSEATDDGIFAICVNGAEATVKRVRLIGDNLLLVPDSTDTSYKEMLFDSNGATQESARIIGRVVWSCLPPDTTP